MENKLKIGILYPHYSAEDDYPRLAAALKPAVEVKVVHTDGPNLHRIDKSLVTGSRENLLAGAEELRPHKVDVCLWACTSGSFAFGVEGARRQAQDLADTLGIPASSRVVPRAGAAVCQSCASVRKSPAEDMSNAPSAVIHKWCPFVSEDTRRRTPSLVGLTIIGSMPRPVRPSGSGCTACTPRRGPQAERDGAENARIGGALHEGLRIECRFRASSPRPLSFPRTSPAKWPPTS